MKYLSLENKGDIHDDVGTIQENLSSEQAAKRQRNNENCAGSVQKACEKRSHEDMACALQKNKANMTADRVLQTNKANMTAASKQTKTRIPAKQVQCQMSRFWVEKGARKRRKNMSFFCAIGVLAQVHTV